VGEDVLVRSGDAEFWVRVADAGGPSTVGIGDAFSFDGVRRTVEEIGVTCRRRGSGSSRARPSWSSA